MELIQREGRLAWDRGLLLRDNPYNEWSDPDSPWSRWRLGWEEGEHAAEAAKGSTP